MKPSEYPQEFLEFVKLFNAGKFFEAHEVLEPLWRKEKEDRRDFYQGLIQIAAVFVHIGKGTPAGGTKLFESAGKYLKKYGPLFMDIEVEKLLSETQSCLASNAPSPQIDRIRLKTL